MYCCTYYYYIPCDVAHDVLCYKGLEVNNALEAARSVCGTPVCFLHDGGGFAL